MANPFSLEGKVALVTGANTGLGQAIAVGLAEVGADIVAAGRSAPDETAELVARTGRKLHAVKADFSSTGPIAGVVEEAFAKAGQVDILINNAGIIRRADTLDFTEEDWDAVMDTNLKSVFFLTQAVARKWVAASRGGKVVNIVSMLSFQGGIRVPSYTASKSGLAGLTKLMACEWASKGINVNAIAPGYFATNNTAALQADEERNAAILARIPAGRWGEPSDLAGAAVFLSSRAADYMHGSIVNVDGGWLAR
ncbi:2-dehydro-3-deoxy-D-gluconate 5-dehydrogenase KduD [Phenylobacterium deserti]|uniref:D-xylose 1-dehydrogenase n=1 Tax=Phenylobacterium deserti TaxID=1914756 RepID=A0A328AT77_9CAUL|nr:2-dehydro-3-deoxy-D-gluconate 5-dehydrogenase KduD [Phenylobacterium deserti]RAK56896.1 2-deoxy-D-gluconate 3-dehydrogenase [Phenylobacterium deserti]